MIRILLVYFFVLSPSYAFDNGDSRGGGDSFAAEFIQIGENVIQMLKKSNPTLIDLKAFQKALKQTKVITKEKLILNGREVDAINDPVKSTIELSRSRWIVTRKDLRLSFVLVFHEYLGILRIEDTDYKVSRTLFSYKGKKLFRLKCDALTEVNRTLKKDYYLTLIGYSDDWSDVFINSAKEGRLYDREWLVTESLYIEDSKKGRILSFNNYDLALRIVYIPFQKILELEEQSGTIPIKTIDLVNSSRTERRTTECEFEKY